MHFLPAVIGTRMTRLLRTHVPSIPAKRSFITNHQTT